MTRREKEVFDNYQNDLIFKFMQLKSTDVDSFEYNLAYAQLRAVSELRFQLLALDNQVGAQSPPPLMTPRTVTSPCKVRVEVVAVVVGALETLMVAIDS